MVTGYPPALLPRQVLAYNNISTTVDAAAVVVRAGLGDRRE